MLVINDCPFVSMRKGALKAFGGTLSNLYKSKHLDNPMYRSRMRRHYTRKDFRVNGQRNYKPWQFNRKIESTSL
jgi:hypothetical protein